MYVFLNILHGGENYYLTCQFSIILITERKIGINTRKY